MSSRDDLRLAPMNRRRFLRAAMAAGAGGLLSGPLISALAEDTVTMPFANGQRRLVTFPQKKPLILLTMRPPQLETPFSVFNDSILTPNDLFFVRYHLSQVPTEIDPDTFRVDIKGKVNAPLSLSLHDLKTQFDQVELVAVNQCSGNGRGFSQPRVAGGQSGNGTMGNARWKGVRLKDILNKAGVAAGAKNVAFQGLDKPPLPTTPAFAKSLDIDHALDGEVMVAYEMNGHDLPMLNGFPLRLVVPGYYGTYWVKHLHEITVLDADFTGFWVSTAYRVPDNDCMCVEPGTTPAKTRPIARYNVRSFITSLKDGDTVTAGKKVKVRGITFDGGNGITGVTFSADGGQTWTDTTLGKDYGKYSFREWTCQFTPPSTGNYELMSRATNRAGETQPMKALWNPSAYMRNVVESVHVIAA
jgi:DMSO/TMAO reductase YedYZ molybdopterin-dependent catalytic subunit